MEEKSFHKLISRTENPDNLEGPREIFGADLTPVDSFFVRSHFDVPELAVEDWRLQIEGAVARRMEWSYQELLQFPQERVRATMECAGNSRARLGERAEGVPWEGSAIGTAEWGGVRLSRVLDGLLLEEEVQELVFVGADRGEVETADGGRLEMAYARSLPLTKALSEEVLLATEMNGAPLSPAHGFPVRLIVPGWYGMASVKWLERIIAVREPFRGYFQTEDYAVWEGEKDLPQRRAVTTMAVKSHIGYPIEGEEIGAGEEVWIRGFAWGGEEAVRAVELSFDGGASFHEARLSPEKHRFGWQGWEYRWKAPLEEGEVEIRARARTVGGEVQPEGHDWARGAYVVNAITPLRVVVRKR